MSVGSFCNREVVVANRDAGVAELAGLMREHHVGSVVIVDDDHGASRPVGVVTDRDIVIELVAMTAPMAELSAGDLMSYELLTATEDDGLWETMQRMRSRGVRRVPVVDAEGSLVGILTADDVLELLAGELGDFARLMARGQGRERETRSRP